MQESSHFHIAAGLALDQHQDDLPENCAMTRRSAAVNGVSFRWAWRNVVTMWTLRFHQHQCQQFIESIVHQGLVVAGELVVLLLGNPVNDPWLGQG
jgi:hypothetical protein